MTHLQLSSITKLYDNKTVAVKNVSLEVQPGEFLVLVGPSGCGKSTLLRMIAGLESISSGDLLFDGKRMNEEPPKNRDIGMVFQNYALYPHLSVGENIGFPLSIRKESKSEIKRKVQEVAEILGLDNALSSKPKELSGGQRQRVALGRAIIRSPRIFLFDEPLSNLDAQLRVQMRSEIIALQRKLGVTAVYVTHDQTEAMTMGDKIAVLKQGEIQQISTPAEMYRNPSNLFVSSFIGSPQINLFHGIIRENPALHFYENSSQFSFQFSKDNFKTMLPADGTELTIGIRPEDLSLTMSSNDQNIQIEAEIKAIEYIGHESLLYFSTNGDMKCCRVPSVATVSVGQKVIFYTLYSHLLLFGKDGSRL
ncbi:MAG: sn-glycerol-3-phosphate ABC transporter ATP-binding protein UgpC [Bacteroidetes bacterium]|nr:sn-glycerol-3-phosphate ABC transporter ATP-binding protein UgpC [Bacteroidota bacterium]